MTTALLRRKPAADAASPAYVLSVLSYEKQAGRCPTCGAETLIYVCHGFGLPWPAGQTIQNRCKPCAIAEAGGEEHVWVKTAWPNLREAWETSRRPAPPACWKAGVEAATRTAR